MRVFAITTDSDSPRTCIGLYSDLRQGFHCGRVNIGCRENRTVQILSRDRHGELLPTGLFTTAITVYEKRHEAFTMNWTEVTASGLFYEDSLSDIPSECDLAIVSISCVKMLGSGEYLATLSKAFEMLNNIRHREVLLLFTNPGTLGRSETLGILEKFQITELTHPAGVDYALVTHHVVLLVKTLITITGLRNVPGLSTWRNRRLNKKLREIFL